MTKKRKMNRLVPGDYINAVILIFLGFIAVYPFLYVLALSLSDYGSVVSGKVFLFPRGLNFEAYKMILGDRRVTWGFMNSILYTVSGTSISVFLTMLTAYPLADQKLKYRRILMRVFIGAMLFSGGLIPFYILIRTLRWIDKIWALIIPGAVSPFLLIITRTFIEQLPGDLFDAAEIDGCGQMRLFLQIVVPLSLPIAATLALNYGLSQWNSFFGPMIFLNTERKFPLQIFLRQIVLASQQLESEAAYGRIFGSSTIVPESVKAGVLVIASVPILVVYPFMQKYFVKGIMIGAIKG
ncbi:MAG: carbohydrate ABC transporter permease [Treponema sp.]|jgi:ABC-type glycerol-3-phosphate transport system permease component|nr:carbohydrate ABC transporter permease [Treponema sp.]